MNKSLIVISVLTLTGCNTVAVNDVDDLDFASDSDSLAYEDAPVYVEAYLCYPQSDYMKKQEPIALITDREDTDLGFVSLSDSIMYPAIHEYHGLERHWSFGCNVEADHCNYRIDLQADGFAHYFDFSKSNEATSSLIMRCTKDADFARSVNRGYFERALLEEERREEEAKKQAARAAGLQTPRQQYIMLIAQRVENNWLRPATTSEDQSCEVIVTQTMTGDVIDVQFQACTSDNAFQSSVERAVRKASPLPLPPDPELFDREIYFKFKPR